MSYEDREGSPTGGAPRELYQFFQGPVDYTYTSFRSVITFEEQFYRPLEITRTEIEGGGTDQPGAVQITVPTDSFIGSLLQAGNAATPMSLRIYRFHEGEIEDYAIIFNGEIQAADVDGEVCVITAVPLQSRMAMPMPRGLYQRGFCAWNTYDTETCKVNPAPFTFAGTVAAIDGLRVTVTGAAAFDADPTFFALGVITKGSYKSPIQAQDGDDMLLDLMIPGLAVGDAVSLLAGDDRTETTCHEKFNNSLRRMSFSQMPIEQPFSGQGLRP